jgi:hypothetical protein
MHGFWPLSPEKSPFQPNLKAKDSAFPRLGLTHAMAMRHFSQGGRRLRIARKALQLRA